ncbi:IGF-like family receptor 1 isoform X3 [Heterocephalus glaber]|nr:IGF-like family receptor 1 isoform X3 [Heterocephalus glaber]
MELQEEYGALRQAVDTELFPATDFWESCCQKECTRAGFCNFMHLQPLSWNLSPVAALWAETQMQCGRGAAVGSPAVAAPRLQAPARMGLRYFLQTVLLLALAAPSEASQYCGPLQYWNPDNKRCSGCLQPFGPPPYPDHEFEENCGLNDFGDHLRHPFKKCSPGQCNPDLAELCSPCNRGALVPTPTGSRGGTQQCYKEKPSPAKGFCAPAAEETSLYTAGAHVTREFQSLMDNSEQCLSTFCPAMGVGLFLSPGPTPNLHPSAKAPPAQGKSRFPSLPWLGSKRPQQLHPLLAVTLPRRFADRVHGKGSFAPTPEHG